MAILRKNKGRDKKKRGRGRLTVVATADTSKQSVFASLDSNRSN